MSISVYIASPKQSQRAHLSAVLSAMSGFVLQGISRDLASTFSDVEQTPPRAVLIAAALAVQPEFEVMRALFESMDVRWLVLRDPTLPFPDTEPKTSGEMAGDLFWIDAMPDADTLHRHLVTLTRSDRSECPAPDVPSPSHRPKNTRRIVLLGASTGGIDALLTILRTFPADCPPTLIVQHTGRGFGESLARLIDRQCLPEAKLVQSKTDVRAGRILIGAGMDAHLVLEHRRTPVANLVRGHAVNGHMPSIDALFESARPFAHQCVAAVLTGMGRDGAKGLKALHDLGTPTLVQDEASCVVFGMPCAAIEIGAADQVLPLDRIGPALLRAAGAHGHHAEAPNHVRI